METLQTTLTQVHDWAIDRIHYLCEVDEDRYSTFNDAYAVKSEFSEWLDPEIKDHNVVSLEYIGD